MADNFTLTIRDGALGAGRPGAGRALLLIGVCSIAVSASAVHAFESPSDVVSTLGYGPLAEMAALALSAGAEGRTARPVGCVRVGTTTNGSNSSVTKAGSGTGTVTLTGNPYDRFEGRIRITRAGTLGVGGFKYSLDGGRSESVEYAIPAGGTFTIPGTNIVATFVPGAGPSYFAVDDTHSWTSTAPTYDTTALATALDVVAADSRQWPLIMVVGPPGGADNAAKGTAAAALAAAVQAKLDAFAALGIFQCALLEGPDVDNDATGAGAVVSALASTVARRAGFIAGFIRSPSQINPRQMRVSASWPYVARAAAIPFSQDPGDGGLGPLDGIIGESLEMSTAARSVYDAGRVACLQTINGVTGYFASNSALLAPIGSDFEELPNRRVIDEASRAGRLKLLEYRRRRIRVNPVGSANAGKIDERDAQQIEQAVRSAIERAILDSGDCSAVRVIVNRTDNILSTKKLRVKLLVTPLGYAKTIEAELSLENPALTA